MDEEDYNVLRNQYSAEPQRYQEWDQNMEMRTRRLQSQQASSRTVPGSSTQPIDEQDATGKEEAHEPLSRMSSSSSTSSSSTTPSSAAAQASQLEEIRTHPPRDASIMNRRATATSTSGSMLARHPTERHPEAIRRIETHRSQHQATVGAVMTRRATSRASRPLPSLGANKPYPPLLPDREEYVVEFDGVDDPLHAQNWPLRKKLGIGAILAFDALAATMGSSIFSAAIRPVSKQFHVDPEVGTLGTSFFVFGYAFGPLAWAPLSELYGRRAPIIIAAFGFSVFSIAVAVGKDIQTILICRFFAGLFGSCPLAVVAAVFADMFNNTVRGLAIAVFSVTVFMGPLLAPCIGGFIVTSHLGWRWTEYISSIMGWLAFVLLLLFLEETYPPVVLVEKAAELRRRTKNWGIHAKQEEIEVDFRELLVKNVSRPMRILFTEPIVLLITLYMSFIYGLLYLLLTAYALVFEGKYGWTPGQSGLAYFGLVVGEMIAFAYVWLDNPRYARKLQANNNIPVPEWRLPVAMVGGVLFAIGLFWFGWSGYTGRTFWVAPVFSGLFIGFGIFSIFLSLLNYLVDAYLMFAASAIAANTFMRSIFGGVFPLFATYMFNGMGIEWASTLLGIVALLLVPMPIIFYLYGKKIRAKSNFAPAPDLKQDKMRDEEARLANDDATSSAGSQNTEAREKREDHV
ncbi:MFS general substrate transporter [Aaosphaeria arxii CBS 175.79]|uniref:MFS general substrate transporter n=1 Tax=Aaosphaeria arxii CBS 175.79 TaxID=1450172 RepID=A0A6A5Y3Y0_9PLEO|nr:MFS general substrate transporter [Aaosphaeria arxii CBS 175.79]KAF2020198.1 MFS general substrate transporter [Aaosphaeria arxii CBS 175.79]